MSKNTTQSISAAQWLEIRDHVAAKLKQAHPRLETATAVKLAEHLLRIGLIDLDDALAAITPEQSPDEGPTDEAP